VWLVVAKYDMHKARRVHKPLAAIDTVVRSVEIVKAIATNMLAGLIPLHEPDVKAFLELVKRR
jgi:hypothetical protein